MEEGSVINERIDLGLAAPTRLGKLTLDPPIRAIRRDDGAQEVVEPRVMQVLIALTEQPGRIVRREELSERCWDGRIVGEDAINRVISRLRRVSETIGAGSFRIETITKIGYRLIPTIADDVADSGYSEITALGAPAQKAASPPAEPNSFSRRWLIMGGGGIVAATALGGEWLYKRGLAKEPPPQAVALLLQASQASGQGTREGFDQALALTKRATEVAPGYADAWGQLAIYYCYALGGDQNDSDLHARSAEAIARAKALDPSNAKARLAEAFMMPSFGNWRAIEITLRANENAGPDKKPFIIALSSVLADVGRCREAAHLSDQVWPPAIIVPQVCYKRAVTLWSAGRLPEADRLMDDAFQLFPSHFGVWFTRLYLFLYTDRAPRALAMIANKDGYPSNIDEANIAMVGDVVRAMIDRTPAAIDRAMQGALDYAHRSAGMAENAIQYASALGRLDEAFAVADAYYFARGFDPGELRFKPTDRVFTRRSERRTAFLFTPSLAAMRRDPRFSALCTELGLTHYWQQAGTRPDFQR